jgi:hypothetical protein
MGQLDHSYVSSPLEGGISGGVQGLGISQGLGMGPWGSAAPAAKVADGSGSIQKVGDGLQMGFRQPSSPWDKINLFSQPGKMPTPMP